MTMQERLSSNILRLTDLMGAAIGRKRWATLRFCTGKTNIINALEPGTTLTFTVATYDEIVQAYSDRWPSGLAWPDDVERPAARPLQVTSAAEPAAAAE